MSDACSLRFTKLPSSWLLTLVNTSADRFTTNFVRRRPHLLGTTSLRSWRSELAAESLLLVSFSSSLALAGCHSDFAQTTFVIYRISGSGSCFRFWFGFPGSGLGSLGGFGDGEVLTECFAKVLGGS